MSDHRQPKNPAKRPEAADAPTEWRDAAAGRHDREAAGSAARSESTRNVASQSTSPIPNAHVWPVDYPRDAVAVADSEPSSHAGPFASAESTRTDGRTEPMDTCGLLDPNETGGSVTAQARDPRLWPRLQERAVARDAMKPAMPPSQLPNGARLVDGRYELLGQLGRGGMGYVLRVFDRDLRRRVAMKVLRPDRLLAGGDIVARFVEEAQIGSQLEHPNIMPIYDLGVLEGGYAYYTMQLVTGRSLGEILAQPRRTRDGLGTPTGIVTEGLDILGKVLSAAAYAHDKGVIHRDLKPANVMVGRFDEVLLMDWGLSKVLGRAAGDADGDSHVDEEESSTSGGTRRRVRIDRDHRSDEVESVRTLTRCETHEGAVAGTLLFMAPEQANGRMDLVDKRTDVWSLGAILYTLLAGRPPHLWGPARLSNAALLRHAREEPARPINRDAREQRIPLGLERIALKALERNPAQRYADAGDMLEAVKEFARGVRRRGLIRGWAGLEGGPADWTRASAMIAFIGALATHAMM